MDVGAVQVGIEWLMAILSELSILQGKSFPLCQSLKTCEIVVAKA